MSRTCPEYINFRNEIVKFDMLVIMLLVQDSNEYKCN